MPNNVYIGIDLGTTVLKACAWDGGTGRLLARADRRIPAKTLRGGGREQKPAGLVRLLARALAELDVAQAGLLGRVAGVGLASQGGSSILAQRATGRAATPMALWNDARGRARVEAVAMGHPPAFWREHTLRDVPPNGLGHIIRLREAHPELFDADHLHCGAGEFVFHALTGQWRQDAGHAIQIGSYNAAGQTLSDTLLQLAGVTTDFVAPLRAGHETAPLSREAARRFGLPEGVPVAGPYIDQEAAWLSALSASARPLQCSLGTAWVGNFTLPDGARGASPYQLVLPSPLDAGALVVQPLLAGNTSWDWALESLIGPPDAIDTAARQLATRPAPAEGLVAVPWVAQPNPLAPGTHGAAAFCGIGPDTTRADCVRAIAMGLCCELARCFAPLYSGDPLRTAGVVDAVVLNGGAAKGDAFRRAIATLFEPLPVYHQTEGDLAPASGSLYAFGCKRIRMGAKRIKPFAGAKAEAVAAYRDHYAAAFERLYGDVAHAAPYHVETA